MSCKICTLAGNDNLQTALGTTPVCSICFENFAETPAALHQAALEALRTGVSIPREIKDNITLHIGDNEYIPMDEWYRKNSQIPCVPKDYNFEPERTLDEIDELERIVLDKIKEIRDEGEFLASLPEMKETEDLFGRLWKRVKNYFTIAFKIDFYNPTR